MADPAANLSFLPWVRQGVAGAIPAADTLAATQPAVAQLQVGLSLNGGASETVALRLRGPADIVGIDANQVVRMEPRPSSSDFEPNHFASVEFDRADLPWLFTPLAPGGEARLRPWLCLVAVQVQDGVALGPAAGGPLPRLTIAAPADPAAELPDLAESWAWAHAQAASGDSSAAAVGDALSGSPQLSLSRLLCPRRLAPNTDYIACVVPTFEVGRKSGLGLAVDPSELNGLAPAWSAAAGGAVTLPVYVSWRFRTAASGDFLTLARRLTARPAPDGLGVRAVDITHPGFALPPSFPHPAIVNVGGALQAADAPEADPSWPAGTQVPFQTALAAIVDQPGQAQASDPNADPVLAPPLYGRWYAARAAAAPGGAPWFDELNLDPRWRSIAAFGVQVVQANQEALMASAWRQAGDLRQANQRVRQLQLSLAVGANLHTRHFGALDDDAIVRVVAPALGRVRTPLGADTAPRTMIARLADTAIPIAATSAAMRRIVRVRGPVTRRAVASTIAHAAVPAPVSVVIAGATTTVRTDLATTSATGAAATTSVGTTGTAAAGIPVIARNWFNGLNLVLSATTATAPQATFATIASVSALIGGSPRIAAYTAVTADDVAKQGPEPLFTVVAEGQPVRVSHPPPTRAPIIDSPSAAAFRTAARAHLARLDPARGVPPPKVLVPFNIGDFRAAVMKGLDPAVTTPALARAVITVAPGVSSPVAATAGIDTVMMAPTFPQPMYEPLRDLSQDLLLPGLEAVLPDSVIGLKTNRRFVDAYMMGLNSEMGGELLWRGFPTDQRGSYFTQFWDTKAASKPRPDIDPPSSWGARTLGQAPAGTADAERFVMLLRGALLQRYPNAIIYAARAVKSGAFRTPSAAPADEVYPIFNGSLQPDLFFFGFPLAAAAVTGSDGSDGYYLVIQEHPTEPRFGLDANVPVTSASVSVAAGLPAGMSAQTFQWGRNSAQMAAITRQLPVRVAIHGSKLAAAVPAQPA